MSNTSTIVGAQKWKSRGFSVIYVSQCLYCGDTQTTDDHHCEGSDKIVDELRNKLDDDNERMGMPPGKWCEHDNTTRRRKLYKKIKKEEL